VARSKCKPAYYKMFEAKWQCHYLRGKNHGLNPWHGKAFVKKCARERHHMI
jgi:hypothetical protein